MHVMAISEKKKRPWIQRREGRSLWESLLEERAGRDLARAVGQSCERRPLYFVAGDSSDKDQLSCWGKHSRWKELMLIGAKFRRHATSPRDWRSWGLRLIRREISDGRLGTVPFPATWARACGLRTGEATLVGAASWWGFGLWSSHRVLLRLLLKTEGNE